MNLTEIASSPHVIRASMFASRHLPIGMGHRLAWWASGLVCRLRPAAYKIVEANLGQVLRSSGNPENLDRLVRNVFYSSVRGYYDLFRALRMPHEELMALIDIPEEARVLAASILNKGTGSVLVFPHLGNFDLGGQAVASLIPGMQLLTLPNPPPGFQLANEFRARTGVKVTPLSPSALRQAIDLLRKGGVVSVAGDRPVSDLDEPVQFFGRPARVPSGHVRLALKTGALLVVACCVLSPATQRYAVQIEPSLEMIRTGDRDEDVRLNMRRVLDLLEGVIRRWLGQWQMFVPVWPERPMGAPGAGSA
jgi:KDO2-lipid IV(A) lauroyltransferase